MFPVRHFIFCSGSLYFFSYLFISCDHNWYVGAIYTVAFIRIFVLSTVDISNLFTNFMISKGLSYHLFHYHNFLSASGLILAEYVMAWNILFTFVINCFTFSSTLFFPDSLIVHDLLSDFVHFYLHLLTSASIISPNIFSIYICMTGTFSIDCVFVLVNSSRVSI